MSKRSRSGRLTTRYAKRVTADNSRRSLLGLNSYVKPVRLRPFAEVSNVQDNRYFHFDDYPNPRNFSGGPVRVVAAPIPEAVRGRPNRSRPLTSFSFLSPRIVVQAPLRAVLCARRKVRKEIIHALGVAGSKVKKPRRNSTSNLHCK